MAANGISTLTIPTGITATSYTQAESYLVAVGTFNYDAYGAGFAIRKDGGTIDAYMTQVIALGAGTRNWTFVPGNGQPSFTRSMSQPDGTNESNDPGETGVDIWNVTTAAGNLGGAGAGQLNTSLIPNGTAFTIYATELGSGGGADKEARQLAKLNIAQAKRQGKTVALDGTISGSVDSTAPWYRTNNTYDIDQLPTRYDGYNIVDNPNDVLTLTPGVIQSGIRKVTYTGYHDEDVAFTDTAVATATTTANNFAISGIGNTIPGDPPENITVLYTGYLLATYTGTWTFVLNSDDGSYLWIGSTAVSGYTTSNELVTSSYAGPGTGTISLTAGEYYPIRLLYGNGPGEGWLSLTYAHTGQSATSDFTGKLFSPSERLVQGRPWNPDTIITVIEDGLILNLDARNLNSWSRAPGEDTWYDLSGNNNHATVYGGIAYGEALGGALAFGGSDAEYAQCPSGVYFTSAGYTIQSWVYVISIPNWNRIIDFGSDAGSDNVLLSSTFGTNGFPTLWVSPSGDNVQSTVQLLANTGWHHVCATWNPTGTVGKIFIDGVLTGTGTVAAPTGGVRANCYIGKSNWGNPPDPNFNGGMGALQIYSRTLLDAEILSNFNTTKSYYGL